MRHVSRCLLVGLFTLATGACDRGKEADRDRSGGPLATASTVKTAASFNPQAESATASGPQQKDEEPLLLLDEPGPAQGSSPPTGPVADNSRCHVCHLNYQTDKLAVAHARNDVGCEKCHGDSSAHCSDENNITPPETMFASDEIDPACQKCHAELTDQHAPFLAGETVEKYCTDCHGFDQHRLTHRTRRWDKKTRQLMASDGVRMSNEAAP